MARPVLTTEEIKHSMVCMFVLIQGGINLRKSFDIVSGKQFCQNYLLPVTSTAWALHIAHTSTPPRMGGQSAPTMSAYVTEY